MATLRSGLEDGCRRSAEQISFYLNLADPEVPFGYNLLSRVTPERRSLVASGILDVFKKMWIDAWGARMEHILKNAVLALLDLEHAVLPDILRLLTDKAFRHQAIDRIVNKQVAAFWREEFPRYSFRYQADGIAPIQNKVGAFLAGPRIYRLLTRTDVHLHVVPLEVSPTAKAIGC